MSKQATVQVRIDEDLKAEAEQLFERLGLSLSEAVRLFVAQSVNERRLPFTPHLSKSEGGTAAFGKLRHYGNPDLPASERAAWLKEQASNTPARGRRPQASDTIETTIVDETVLLHYLLNDAPRPAAKARRIIASGAAQAYPETIALVAELLERDYRVPRSLIGTVIELLADDVSIENGTVVRLAARLYGSNRLTFANCLLAARNVLTGHKIETSNKALSRATV